jgi:hypothetical protein
MEPPQRTNARTTGGAPKPIMAMPVRIEAMQLVTKIAFGDLERRSIISTPSG